MQVCVFSVCVCVSVFHFMCVCVFDSTVGVMQGVGSIVGPPIRSTISKAVALEDQGHLNSIQCAV